MKKVLDQIGMAIFSINIWSRVKNYIDRDIKIASAILIQKVEELRNDPETPSHLGLVRIEDKENKSCLDVSCLKKGDSLDDPRNYSHLYADFSIMRHGHGPLLVFRMGKNYCILESGRDIPEADLKKFKGIVPFSLQSPDFESLILFNFFHKIEQIKKIVGQEINASLENVRRNEEILRQKMLQSYKEE